LSTTSALSYAGTKMKVELDKKALFALASDSRMEILKALHPQRRTVAQLADQLDIDKAAVHRHLKKLEEGELVVRFEDHGFVYYGLSWKARDVISPGENTKIVIVFGLSALLVTGAAGAFLTSLGSMGLRAGEAATPAGDPLNGASDYGAISTLSPELLALGLLLVALAGVLIYFGIRRLRRPKQRPSPEDGASPHRAEPASD
ncbi:MAG: winged helix-turn-helix domain-containing protein, partial [Methanomassiliicoccales archaeon]|nr:winged helix-turn-helix domain-containing protein [Methanomassiliicoccales archaeon]